jgi:hypothetical protein
MLARISTLFHSWAKGWLVLVIFVAFVIFIAITLPILQSSPGGSIKSLDARIFYMPEEAFSTVSSYGEASGFWVRTYLTWDLVNPILYTLIFSLLISWLFQRSFGSDSKLQKFNVAPAAAGLFDLLENFSIVIMLLAHPAQPAIVAWLSTAFTMSKTIFLAASALLVLIGAVGAALNRFKKQPQISARSRDVLET